jgi:hypothetical protein
MFESRTTAQGNREVRRIGMRRVLFATAAISVAAIVGCSQSPNTPQEQRAAEKQEGGIKVRAPGVDVDIEKSPKKKVGVDVHPNR